MVMQRCTIISADGHVYGFGLGTLDLQGVESMYNKE